MLILMTYYITKLNSPKEIYIYIYIYRMYISTTMIRHSNKQKEKNRLIIQLNKYNLKMQLLITLTDQLMKISSGRFRQADN